jgi:hypothetical protein
MKYFCPQCYGKKMVTVELAPAEGGVYVCTANAQHRFLIDKDGYPRSKKD